MILFQVFVLLLLSAGWGYWVWRIALRRSSERYTWFLAGLGGYSLQVLVLEKFIYLDIPLQLSSWGALLIALLGVGFLLVQWSRIQWTNVMPIAACFLILFVLQGAGLLYRGESDYYGNAHTDQMSWVSLSQFLVEQPYNQTPDEAARSPFRWKAVSMKGLRPAACVALAETAVLSRSDAKRAYGVQTVFFVILLSLSTIVLFRRFSVPLSFSLLGGLWLGVTPALTKLHLDGFFTQVGGIFVLPAVLATRSLFVQTVLLAYLYCAYTEFYPIALAMVLAIRLTSKEFVPAVIIPLLSLTMSFPWLLRSIHMLREHAGMTSVPWLEVLFPFAGSLKGWALYFFRPSLPLFAAGLGILAISAFFSRSLIKRLQLALIACLALGALSVLPPGRYLFWKLSVGLIWLWIFLAVLGVCRLGMMLPRRWRFNGYPASLVILCLIALSVRGSVLEMQEVIKGSGNIRAVAAPEVREMYHYLEQHPNQTFLISVEHPIVAGWLAYHGRKANIFFDRSVISESDPDLPPASMPFFQPPANATVIDLVRVKGDGFSWRVVNPQGRDEDETGSWYWLGDQMEILIQNLRQGPLKVAIVLHAIPGPANPDPNRLVAVTDGLTSQQFSFSAETRIKAIVELKPGLNAIQVKTVQPIEQVVRFPLDPRKHMVRINRIQVQSNPGEARASGPQS